MHGAALSRLPSVDQVLHAPTGQVASERHGHQQTVAAIRQCLAQCRASLLAGSHVDTEIDALATRVLAALEAAAIPRARPVFNLTGTVLHTNLGRALLAEEAIEAANLAMRAPVALEFDLATGRRGQRDDIVRDLLRELTGAEDATIV